MTGRTGSITTDPAWTAVVWVAMVGLLGMWLPFVFLFFHVVFGDLFPTSGEPWIRGALHPFLFSQQTIVHSTHTETVPVSGSPLLFTLVQWVAMGAASGLLVRHGLIRRPVVAAFAIIGLAGCVGAFWLLASGYGVSKLRM